jgi:hypothetical protein
MNFFLLCDDRLFAPQNISIGTGRAQACRAPVSDAAAMRCFCQFPQPMAQFQSWQIGPYDRE